ncbi:MAG: response regulator [Elusimicrobia bacterium]|nr:response regulator [Elusimicrobiota bacterium]
MSRILIIDDDVSIVELLGDVLAREGHAVETAGDAGEGMRKARACNPDLIILDYHMPGMTGAHLYESLRRNRATGRTPILFMSGEASADDILKEIADPEGASYLAKPVHLQDFRRAVRQLLGT